MLKDLKGNEAFKAMGRVIGGFRKLFKDPTLAEIAAKKPQGWILEFFEISLDEHSDIWMDMFLALNPDKAEEDISLGSVIKFALEIKNDEEIMSLFFSQSDQTENTPSGSLTENTEETEKT